MRLLCKHARGLRADDGGATVEATLWLPIYTLAIVLILDATFIFKGESRVHSIVQDGMRQYILGAYRGTPDPEEALEDWIEHRLAITGLTARAEAVVVLKPDAGLTATVSYPSGDTDLSGVTGLLGGLTMRVTSHYNTEY